MYITAKKTNNFSHTNAYCMTNLYGEETENKTYICFRRDEENIYVKFKAYFSNPLPQRYKRKTGKVYRSDCVELFLAFEENANDYYEFDVSPFNKTFAAKIKNLDDCNVQAFPFQNGLITTTAKILDDYYEIVYSIPLRSFPEYKGEIYLNAYRVEMQKNKRISRSLIPTYSISHHIRKSFQKLNFEG